MYLRARTQEQFDERKKQILEAMDSLYLNKALNDIFLKDISELTRISRTAIYFYYKSKEEILLDSLYNHFVELDDGLETLVEKDYLKEEMIDLIANLLDKNMIILKIMSSNLEEIERSTSLENLIVFKNEIKRFQNIFINIVKKYNCKKDPETILVTFSTMLYGYYPIAYPNPIQKEAMEKTGTYIKLALKDVIASSLKILFE